MRIWMISVIAACLIFPLAPAIGNDAAQGNKPILSDEEDKENKQQGDRNEAGGDEEPECE